MCQIGLGGQMCCAEGGRERTNPPSTPVSRIPLGKFGIVGLVRSAIMLDSHMNTIKKISLS